MAPVTNHSHQWILLSSIPKTVIRQNITLNTSEGNWYRVLIIMNEKIYNLITIYISHFCCVKDNVLFILAILVPLKFLNTCFGVCYNTLKAIRYLIIHFASQKPCPFLLVSPQPSN